MLQLLFLQYSVVQMCFSQYKPSFIILAKLDIISEPNSFWLLIHLSMLPGWINPQTNGMCSYTVA